jgi:Flp pilus assembly protein CpaB
MNAYLSRAAAASGWNGPDVAVVAARSAVARGATLRTDQLGVTHVPKAFAPPGAIARVSQAAGRVALAALAPGEVVTETRLGRVREGPVASLTPEGLRAFAVPASLPRGTVVAGDHIDVLATYTSGQPHTEVAAAGVEVLTVLAPPSAGDAGGLPGATGSGDARSLLVLLVSPDQAQQLASATAFATLSIAVV